MKLRHKAWILTAFVFSACVAIALIGLFALKQAANIDNEARVKQLMLSAASTITTMENLAASGVLSEEAAKKIATAILRENKYHASEYCFAVDENLNFVAAPLDPQLHGTSFNDFKDDKGQSVGKLALAALEKSGGKLTTYTWDSYDEKKNVRATIVSVAVQSPRWKWIVGNGLSDAEANARFYASSKSLLSLSVLAGAAVLAALLFSVHQLVKSLGGEPEAVVKKIQRVAGGDFTGEQWKAGEERPDKDSILGVVDSMRASLERVLHEVAQSAESMRNASREIASGNEDLQNRTETTAQSLQAVVVRLAAPDRYSRRERQGRRAGRQGGHRSVGSRDSRRRGRFRGRRHDGRDQCQLETHPRHHRGHRWHRLPDQHPRIECGRGVRARR